jgi:hypothetical protein
MIDTYSVFGYGKFSIIQGGSNFFVALNSAFMICKENDWSSLY